MSVLCAGVWEGGEEGDSVLISYLSILLLTHSGTLNDHSP